MAPILTRVGQSFGFGAPAGGGGGPKGMTASGGIISEYADGSDYYRAHTFNSNGRFVVTAESAHYPNSLEYVVIGGGGSGGASNGGGGGAGGFKTNLSGDPYAPSGISITASATGGPANDGVYPVAIGYGGQGGHGMPTRKVGRAGFDTVFTVSPTVNVTAAGGGAGGTEGVPGGQQNGGDGGSGGGGNGYNNGSGGSASPFGSQGNAGQAGTNTGGPGRYGGGGGGAGSAGGSPTGQNGRGGSGHPSVLQYGPTTTNDSIDTQKYAGGGGGATGPGDINCYSASPNSGGGGAGSTPTYRPSRMGSMGADGLGGGGGGSFNNHPGSQGGCGTVIIRYKIDASECSPSVVGTRKASGGHMSSYNGKVIHIFTNSGIFKTKAGFNETIEYVIVGGGGGGGSNGPGPGQSGGGGSGQYRGRNDHSLSTPTAESISVVIGQGGSGASGPTASAFYNTAEVSGVASYISFPTGQVKSGAGGAGGQTDQNSCAGLDGGSGGGAGKAPATGGGSSSDFFPGTPGNSPPLGWAGGGGSNPGPGHGAGGGGAGSSPTNDSGNSNAGNGPGGVGGWGIQLPATFRNPQMAPDPAAAATTLNVFKGGGLGTPGPNGMFYVAGGGGGHQSPDAPTSIAGGAGGGGSSWAPGNAGQGYEYSGGNALANTGSGGGGGCAPGGNGGAGGSGIVLIAYPEQDRLKSVTLNPFWMPGGVILCLFVNDYGTNRITETTLHRILCMVHALGCSCYHFAF